MEYHIGKYLEDKPYKSLGASTDLEGFSVSFKEAKVLNYNYIPDTRSSITSIYSESVPQPDFAQGYANDFVGIKFLTRGSDQQTTRNLAWDIHRAISQLGDIEITAQEETVYIVSVDIVNPPTFLEVDEKGRIVFVSHYSVHAETEGNAFRQPTTTN